VWTPFIRLRSIRRQNGPFFTIQIRQFGIQRGLNICPIRHSAFSRPCKFASFTYIHSPISHSFAVLQVEVNRPGKWQQRTSQLRPNLISMRLPNPSGTRSFGARLQTSADHVGGGEEGGARRALSFAALSSLAQTTWGSVLSFKRRRPCPLSRSSSTICECKSCIY